MSEKFEIYQNDLILENGKVNWEESINKNKSLYYKSKSNNKIFCVTMFKKHENNRKKIYVMFDNQTFIVNKASLLQGFVWRIINYKEIEMGKRFSDEDRYCVYCHVNKINNKRYIGISSKSPTKRWGNNGCHYSEQVFGKAIKKYGWDNFEHLILMENLTQDEAELAEISLIEKYHTTDSAYGYNVSTGGQIHRSMTEEAKERLRNKYTGRKLTPEWIANRSLAQVGLKRSTETKMRIKNALSVPVICINNRQIFKSLTEAADTYNISVSHISLCCNKKRDFAGVDEAGQSLYWMFYSEYIENNIENKPNDEIIPKRTCIGRKGIAVRNKITNEIYKSIREASSKSNIGVDKIKSDIRTNSLIWEYFTNKGTRGVANA